MFLANAASPMRQWRSGNSLVLPYTAEGDDERTRLRW